MPTSYKGTGPSLTTKLPPKRQASTVKPLYITAIWAKNNDLNKAERRQLMDWTTRFPQLQERIEKSGARQVYTNIHSLWLQLKKNTASAPNSANSLESNKSTKRPNSANLRKKVIKRSGTICGITLADTEHLDTAEVNHIIALSASSLIRGSNNGLTDLGLNHTKDLNDPCNLCMTLKTINGALWDQYYLYVDENDVICSDYIEHPDVVRTVVRMVQVVSENEVIKKTPESAIGQKYVFANTMTEEQIRDTRECFRFHKVLYDVVHSKGGAGHIDEELVEDGEMIEPTSGNLCLQ